METRDKMRSSFSHDWILFVVCVYIDLINNVDQPIVILSFPRWWSLVSSIFVVSQLPPPPGHIEKVTLHSRVVFRKPMKMYDPLSHDFFHAMSVQSCHWTSKINQGWRCCGDFQIIYAVLVSMQRGFGCGDNTVWWLHFQTVAATFNGCGDFWIQCTHWPDYVVMHEIKCQYWVNANILMTNLYLS